MVVLIDTNIILDQMLRNEGFYEDAEDVMTLSEQGVIDGYVSASAITDIYYIARKAFRDKGKALHLIAKLTDIVHIATVDEGIVKSAINLSWNDFEDSIQYAAGESIKADYIITRNTKDFADSNISVISPADFLASISSD